MKYSWILLDADGTLFDFDRAAAASLAETFAALGLPWQPSHLDVYEKINLAAWRAFEAGQLTADELKVRRFADLLDALGLAGDPVAFGRTYLECLATHDDLLPGAEALVDNLAGRAGLVLLTNGLTEVQRPRFAKAPICRRFDHLVISGEVGCAKPDPAIFDLVFERIGHPDRRDVLMVGDSLSSDIAGGRGYGLDTVWYNPDGRPRGDGPVPTHEIHSLVELLPLL